MKRQRHAFRMLTIPVWLSKEEHAALKALCTEERIGRSALVEAFISDLTQSRRCVTADFDWWLEQRSLSHPVLSCYGFHESPANTAPSEIGRRARWLWLWQRKAQEARNGAG